MVEGGGGGPWADNLALLASSFHSVQSGVTHCKEESMSGEDLCCRK